jgi:1-acyl-sn-glycerol-3-phosphate acyltransferase
MTLAVKGFPAKFPVRDDDLRPLRYRFAAGLGRVYLRVFSWRRLRFEGVENVPVEGPLLVASNHVSNRDPLLFGGYFPQTLFALAKREMFANRALAWFFAGCNSIPVDRGRPDRRAVSLALTVLGRGGRLLVFVEGTRSRDGRMHRAEPGIGFLARRSGVPVLPVAVSGSDSHGPRSGLLRRRTILVRYGRTFTLDVTGRRDDAVIADEIAGRVAALLPAARRGVYAAEALAVNDPAPGLPTPAR